MRIAILDDYQSVALTMADWSPVQQRAEVTVFSDHLTDEDALAQRLVSFDVLCVMRERTALRRSLIERLPNLKMIASTGPINAAIDAKAAEERGIALAHTGYSSTPTVELTWALILACQRHLLSEAGSLRAGGWQRMVGGDLEGRTLGLLGLGNIGGRVAQIGRAFGMSVIGWSQNLTQEKPGRWGRRLSGRRCCSAKPISSASIRCSCRRDRPDEADGLADQHVARGDRGSARPAGGP
jgi:phosphoglycerate dehydrogenase-like enzyme